VIATGTKRSQLKLQCVTRMLSPLASTGHAGSHAPVFVIRDDPNAKHLAEPSAAITAGAVLSVLELSVV